METNQTSTTEIDSKEIETSSIDTAQVEAAPVEAAPVEAKKINTKEIIAYLTEKFPACFSIEGAVKPLKIGIFQELAEQLAEDDKVSKTRLRQALRHYTSSWRYLKSIKKEAFRIDLTGADCEKIDDAQAEYAAKTLKESQAKVADRKPKKATPAKSVDDKKTKAPRKADDKKRQEKFKSVTSSKPVVKKEVKPLVAVDTASIAVDQKVKVKIGNAPMNATITEISGKDISVQLDSGMVVKTQLKNIYSE
jgi:ProP effector